MVFTFTPKKGGMVIDLNPEIAVYSTSTRRACILAKTGAQLALLTIRHEGVLARIRDVLTGRLFVTRGLLDFFF